MLNQKKLIFITGGGRGIGRTLCRFLAQEGYLVSACARTPGELQETARGYEGTIFTNTVDVTNQDQVKNWILSEVHTHSTSVPFGLITAAGIHGEIGPFIDVDFNLWKKGIEVNLYGSLFTAQIFAQVLRDKKISGRVLFFSGGAATKGMPHFTSYGASKTAIVRMSETLAMEWKNLGISVNAIAPGAVATNLQKEVIEKGVECAGAERVLEAQKTFENRGTPPEKAAQLCSFLLKPGAEKITGRLFSAVWDNMNFIEENWNHIKETDLYQLRRITEQERPFHK